MDTQTVKEKPTDQPVYLYNTNSNFPEKIESFPEIHLSQYNLAPVLWCEIQGCPVGVIR